MSAGRLNFVYWTDAFIGGLDNIKMLYQLRSFSRQIRERMHTDITVKYLLQCFKEHSQGIENMPSFRMYHMDWPSCALFKMLFSLLYSTLCDPMDCSLQGSSVHGILQARILEWVAIPFSRGSPNPEVEPGSSILQADALSYEPPGIQLYHYAFYAQSKFSMALSHLDPYIITNNHANASHLRQRSEIRPKGNRKK